MEINNKEDVKKVLGYYINGVDKATNNKDKDDAFVRGLIAGAKGLAEAMENYMDLP